MPSIFNDGNQISNVLYWNPTLTDVSQTIAWIKSTLVDEKEWNWAFILKE